MRKNHSRPFWALLVIALLCVTQVQALNIIGPSGARLNVNTTIQVGGEGSVSISGGEGIYVSPDPLVGEGYISADFDAFTNKTLVSWNNISGVPILTNGTDGSDGSDGADGSPGINGINGTNGINGINGTNEYLNVTKLINASVLAYTNLTGAPTTIDWVNVTNKATMWDWLNITNKASTWDWINITNKATLWDWTNITNKPNTTDQTYVTTNFGGLSLSNIWSGLWNYFFNINASRINATRIDAFGINASSINATTINGALNASQIDRGNLSYARITDFSNATKIPCQNITGADADFCNDAVGGAGDANTVFTTSSAYFSNQSGIHFIGLNATSINTTVLKATAFNVTSVNVSNLNSSGFLSANQLLGNVSAPNGIYRGGVYAKTCSGNDKVSSITSTGDVTCTTDQTGAGAATDLSPVSIAMWEGTQSAAIVASLGLNLPLVRAEWDNTGVAGLGNRTRRYVNASELGNLVKLCVNAKIVVAATQPRLINFSIYQVSDMGVEMNELIKYGMNYSRVGVTHTNCTPWTSSTSFWSTGQNMTIGLRAGGGDGAADISVGEISLWAKNRTVTN